MNSLFFHVKRTYTPSEVVLIDKNALTLAIRAFHVKEIVRFRYIIDKLILSTTRKMFFLCRNLTKIYFCVK